MSDFFSHIAKVLRDRDYKHIAQIEVCVYNSESNIMEIHLSKYDELDKRYFVTTQNNMRFVGNTTDELYEVVQRYNAHYQR